MEAWGRMGAPCWEGERQEVVEEGEVEVGGTD